MARILVVEDEETIRNLICWNLELVGHSSSSAADGWEAKRMLENQQFDLILLDVMLPSIDGFHLAEYCSGTPVMFVTAKDEIQDKMKGFQAGAEDYLVKPFEIVELLARVHVILRRNGTEESGIRIGDVRIDMTSRAVYRKGMEVELTPQEYEKIFLKNGLSFELWQNGIFRASRSFSSAWCGICWKMQSVPAKRGERSRSYGKRDSYAFWMTASRWRPENWKRSWNPFTGLTRQGAENGGEADWDWPSVRKSSSCIGERSGWRASREREQKFL